MNICACRNRRAITRVQRVSNGLFWVWWHDEQANSSESRRQDKINRFVPSISDEISDHRHCLFSNNLLSLRVILASWKTVWMALRVNTWEKSTRNMRQLTSCTGHHARQLMKECEQTCSHSPKARMERSPPEIWANFKWKVGHWID